MEGIQFSQEVMSRDSLHPEDTKDMETLLNTVLNSRTPGYSQAVEQICKFLHKVRWSKVVNYDLLQKVFKCLQTWALSAAVTSLLKMGLIPILAGLYDNLLQRDYSKSEVYTTILELLFIVEDLSENPEGKLECGRLFLVRLLAIATTKLPSVKLHRAAVETICALVTKSPDNQEALLDDVTNCYKLFKVILPKCGDFQSQASITEILYRLARRGPQLLDFLQDKEVRKSIESLMKSKQPDLLSGIRSTVMRLNESLGRFRSVYSFVAEQIVINGHKMVTPEKWVNFGASQLSFDILGLPNTTMDGPSIVDIQYNSITEVETCSPALLEISVHEISGLSSLLKGITNTGRASKLDQIQMCFISDDLKTIETHILPKIRTQTGAQAAKESLNLCSSGLETTWKRTKGGLGCKSSSIELPKKIKSTRLAQQVSEPSLDNASSVLPTDTVNPWKKVGARDEIAPGDDPQLPQSHTGCPDTLEEHLQHTQLAPEFVPETPQDSVPLQAGKSAPALDKRSLGAASNGRHLSAHVAEDSKDATTEETCRRELRTKKRQDEQFNQTPAENTNRPGYSEKETLNNPVEPEKPRSDAEITTRHQVTEETCRREHRTKRRQDELFNQKPAEISGDAGDLNNTYGQLRKNDGVSQEIQQLSVSDSDNRNDPDYTSGRRAEAFHRKPTEIGNNVDRTTPSPGTEGEKGHNGVRILRHRQCKKPTKYFDDEKQGEDEVDDSRSDQSERNLSKSLLSNPTETGKLPLPAKRDKSTSSPIKGEMLGAKPFFQRLTVSKPENRTDKKGLQAATSYEVATASHLQEDNVEDKLDDVRTEQRSRKTLKRVLCNPSETGKLSSPAERDKSTARHRKGNALGEKPTRQKSTVLKSDSRTDKKGLQAATTCKVANASRSQEDNVEGKLDDSQTEQRGRKRMKPVLSNPTMATKLSKLHLAAQRIKSAVCSKKDKTLAEHPPRHRTTMPIPQSRTNSFSKMLGLQVPTAISKVAKLPKANEETWVDVFCFQSELEPEPSNNHAELSCKVRRKYVNSYRRKTPRKTPPLGFHDVRIKARQQSCISSDEPNRVLPDESPIKSSPSKSFARCLQEEQSDGVPEDQEDHNEEKSFSLPSDGDLISSRHERGQETHFRERLTKDSRVHNWKSMKIKALELPEIDGATNELSDKSPASSMNTETPAVEDTALACESSREVELVASLLNKFKQKVKLDEKRNVANIISTTSQRIQHELQSAEERVQDDRAEFAEHCKRKCEHLDSQLQVKTKKILLYYEKVQNDFGQYLQEREKIVSELQEAEVQLQNVVKLRGQQHKTLHDQLQEFCTNTLAEAQQMIVKQEKSASSMHGLKDALKGFLTDF